MATEQRKQRRQHEMVKKLVQAQEELTRVQSENLELKTQRMRVDAELTKVRAELDGLRQLPDDMRELLANNTQLMIQRAELQEKLDTQSGAYKFLLDERDTAKFQAEKYRCQFEELNSQERDAKKLRSRLIKAKQRQDELMTQLNQMRRQENAI
jgi:uncharacterized protein (DUF3084 family)